MVALNSQFDILRGWPNSSAVQEDFVIGNSSNDHKDFTHPHATGTWVSLAATTDGSMSTADSNATSSASSSCYLIIEGVDDLSSRFSKRVTCLLGGGYIVRIPETYRDSDNSTIRCIKNGEFGNCTVGVKVLVVDNELAPAAIAALDADADNALAQANGDDVASINNRAAVVGTVIAHNALNKTIDVYVH